MRRHLDYWRHQLRGAPEALDLPTDRPRPPIESFRGAIQRFQVSPKTSAALKQLSQHEGASLFMTLLAAFNVLLYRYTSQTDILVGTPVANREHREIEGLIESCSPASARPCWKPTPIRPCPLKA